MGRRPCVWTVHRRAERALKGALLRSSCGGAAGASKRCCAAPAAERLGRQSAARSAPEKVQSGDRRCAQTHPSGKKGQHVFHRYINLYHIFDLQPFWFPPFCSGPLPSATDVDRDAHAVPGVRLSATADKGLVDAKPAVLPQTQHPPIQLL